MEHYENERTGEATRDFLEAWDWHKKGDKVTVWYGTEFIRIAFEN